VGSGSVFDEPAPVPGEDPLEGLGELPTPEVEPGDGEGDGEGGGGVGTVAEAEAEFADHRIDPEAAPGRAAWTT